MEIFINNRLCKVCLCSDRTLTPLGKYLELFTRICRKLKPSYKTGDLLICWECLTVLQKVEKFQEKVLKAQSFFNTVDKSLDDQMQNNLNLSSLQMVLNKDITYYFLAKESIEPRDEVIDCDIIKKENVDLKYTNDEIFNQNDLCDKKAERLDDVVKDEKIDINQEILNNLFDININEVTDFKGEIEDDDHQYVDDDFVYIESFTKKKKKVKKQPKKREYKEYKRRPYRVVYNSRVGTKNALSYNPYVANLIFDKIPIDMSELMLLREEMKSVKFYTRMEFKCELCIVGFRNKSTHSLHMKSHDRSTSYECEICHQRFSQKCHLATHCGTHMYKYRCQICQATYLTKRWILDHIRTHDKAYECVECGRQFKLKSEVFEHHKTHVEFICDICGKKALKKHLLEKHMRIKHLPHICKICNFTFKSNRIYRNHITEKHVTMRTEEAFCVECNVQFDNVPMYKRHLNTSVKHKPKSNIKWPCPECHKLFNKKMNMKYHYNYFHTDRTNFYCESCAKFFLNNYQLRRHKAVFHDKIKPVKNKFCPHCGRGFSERRILNNHIRTHTGERPYVCALCSAAFTQSYPLTTHMRSVHKIGGKRVSAVK